MFWNLCNIDQALSDRERVEALKPLTNGESFVVVQVDGKETKI